MKIFVTLNVDKNLVVFSVLVSLIVLLIFHKYLKRKPCAVKYINRNLPRLSWYKIPLPILDGYITMLKIRKDVREIEAAMRKYGSSFMIPFAYSDIMLVTDVEIVKKILTSNSPQHLNKPKVYELIFTKPGTAGLFGAEYKIWSVHRKVIGPAATYKGFAIYVKFMNKEAQVLAKEACATAAESSLCQLDNIQMKGLMARCLVKIITSILMGTEESDVGEDARTKLHSAIEEYITLAMDRYLHPYEFIPIVWKLHPRRRQMDKYLQIITEFSNTIANKYRQNRLNQTSKGFPEENLKTGVKPFQCMVEHMIQGGLSNTEIIDEIITFLAAGQETITGTLDMLIFHLASNPDCQQNCYQEICQVLEHKQNDLDMNITMENLNELKYLERCVLEGMRITPTVPYILRRLDAPLEIGKHTFIEGNTVAFIAPWVIHRNPEIYPNPEQFDPDRFLSENVKLRHSHAYIPFSMGPRNCVGWKIAMLELEMIIAWILKHFRLSTEDKLDDVKLMFDITLKPERLFNVKFTRR